MAAKKSNRTYTHYVVCAYDGPYGQKGDIVSSHTSYDLADKALKRRAPGESGNWLRIADASEHDNA